MKVGDRRVISDPASILDANSKVSVECVCGNIKKIGIYGFYKSKSKNCGECELYRFKTSGEVRFNKLTIIDDISKIKNFGQKIRVKCDCGTVITGQLRQVYYGRKTSCGNCSLNKFIQKGSTTFHHLVLLTPLDQISSWLQRVDVQCSCGNKTKVIYRNLFTGNSKSCGKCELHKFKASGKLTFNDLTLITPPESIQKLSQQVYFKCSCGSKSLHKLYNVMVGHTRRCGKCRSSVYSVFKANHEKLSLPISPGVLFGCIKHSNTITSGRTVLQAKCPICGSDWYPRYKDVKRGLSLSCGCSSNRISTQNIEIKDFIRSLGVNAHLEGKLGKYKYDVLIEDHMIVIEYHGLKWHSMQDDRPDIEKTKNAKKLGYDSLIIYGDEWEEKQSQICSIIANRLGSGHRIKLRPSSCEVQTVGYKLADKFYGQYHYIGPTKATINIAVVHHNIIIACMSFKSPNRQSRYQYELTRMASDNKHAVHGVWSFLFKKFIRQYAPESVVSFSDNRLFSGEVYRKMGFKLDGKVRPNYYWVKGRHRYNKSGLRKPKGATGTESEIRRSQNFSKIWDIGKKRWVWLPTTSTTPGSPVDVATK